MGVYQHSGDSKLKDDRRQMGFFEALLGFVMAPGFTAETLLSEVRPPHGFAFLALLIISIFTPILSKVVKTPNPEQFIPALLSLFALVFVTLILFIILECWILLILRIEMPVSIMLTCIGYTFAPVVFAILLTYGLNYFGSGELSLANVMLDIGNPPPPGFLKMLPYIIGIAALIAMWVFYNSIRFVGELGGFTTSIITLVALLPFFASFATGLFIADRVRPGTVELVINVLFDPRGFTERGDGERLKTILP